MGRNIGATTERLCGSKESLGFSLKVRVQWHQDLWMFWEIGNIYSSNEKALEDSAD